MIAAEQIIYNADIPEPLLFNTLKHHAISICNIINSIDLQIVTNKLRIKRFLAKIGQAQTDIYFGSLIVSQICEETMQYLERHSRISQASYMDWITKNPRKYCTIELSDRSTWIFLKGNEPGRYVHIHPGRNSVYVERVRANELKTVIIAVVGARSFNESPFDLKLVNRMRMKYLDLSPIKTLKSGEGIHKIIEHFEKLCLR